MNIYYLFFLMLLLSYNIGKAQSYNEDIRFFNTENGLIDNAVHAVFQDVNDFIWIGTRFGLSRFDGYKFKNWTRKNSGYNLERISKIGQDDAGWLWLWNDEGVLFMNPVTEEIITEQQRFPQGIPFDTDLKVIGSWKYWAERYIPTDREGRLYFIADNYLITFLEKEGFVKTKIKDSRTFVLKQVTENSIWATANHSTLIQLSKTGHLLKEYPLLEKKRIITTVDSTEGGIVFNTMIHGANDQYKAFYINGEKKQAVLLALNFGKGKIFYNPSKQLIFVGSDKGWGIYNTDFEQVKEIDAKKYIDKLPLAINCHLTDRLGRNWLGSDFGLTLLNLESSHFKNYFSFVQEEARPYNNSARGIYVQNDNLYVNFEMGGFTKIKLDSSDLNNNELLDRTYGISNVLVENGRYPYWGRPILPATEDTLWIGSDGSLRKHDLQGNILEKYPLNPKGKILYQKDIWSLKQDKKGNIWIGTGNGLAIKRKGQSYIQYLKTDASWQLQDAVIFNIINEGNTHYWLCTNKGLYLLNTETEIIEAYYSREGEESYHLPVQNIRHLYKDQEGFYWIASTEGLVKWDKKTGIHKHLDASDGMTGEVLTAVYEDDFGFLWTASDKSIMQINKSDYTIKTFLTQDGIQKEYNRISHYQDKEGTIYFGGINGVTAFYPQDFYATNDSTKTTLAISEYQHFDGDKNEIVRIPCSGNKQLTVNLLPKDRFFTLEVAQLNYEEEGVNDYAYKIEGLDKDWINPISRQFWFGRLPYGEHTIHLRGINKRNNSHSFLQVKVNVVKPFYLQNWFLLLSLGVIIGSLYTFNRWRLYRLEKQKQYLEQEVKKATIKIRKDKETIEQQAQRLEILNSTKDRLFSIISHDLRKPALAFRGISKKVKFLIQEQEFNTLTKYGDALENAAHSLNNLLDNLLKWSLQQRDMLPYEPIEINVAEVTTEIVGLYEQMAADKGISIKTMLSPLDTAFVDYNAYATIIRNLLDNAIKFTPKGGRIELATQKGSESLILTIKDTGLGMSSEQVAQLFDWQKNKSTRGTEGEKGTGLGMSLVNDLVNLNKGSIAVESMPNKGTVFKLRLPLKTA